MAVTWGGNQTAADGGLDVRVALLPGVSIEGFVPRPLTGSLCEALDDVDNASQLHTDFYDCTRLAT